MRHRCGKKVHNRPALYRHRTSLGFKIQGLLSASSDQLQKLKDPTMGEIETTTQETIGWETKVSTEQQQASPEEPGQFLNHLRHHNEQLASKH